MTVLEQLRLGPPTDRLWGWVTTLVITGIAFLIRWWRIGYPDRIMFDETYYAKDAYSLLQYGYEGVWDGKGEVVNPAFALGDTSALSPSASFIVHPEVGKWLIAAGEQLFGVNSFGWRFGSLVFGTLLVFIVIRLARRLSRSTLIGGIAGVLLTVDGLSFVMSRIALLDIFQAFFIVAGVSCVVADRDFFRHRLADALEKLPDATFAGKPGPFVFRPWLLGAGVLFGLACGTKWNSMYPLAVFGVMVVVWSISARRLAGARGSAMWGLLTDGVPAFISMVVVAVGVYLATWIPWLRTSGGYDRGWGAGHLDDWTVRHFGQDLGSLWHYHVDMYNWHTGDTMANATHSYASSPWGWPVVARTVGIMAENDIKPGDQGCTAAVGKTCMRVITGLGTPLLWWAATIAILIALVWWLAAMDWRFSVPVLGMFSTWIPWMFAGTRPEFAFYAITMIPFMVIALAMVLGVVLGPADSGPRRQSGGIIVGTIVGLIILDFAFNYPIYTGQLMTRTQWQLRMWLPGWV
ncbi:MAG: phospholipid carrier-dependent glycosyltransferase [Propionibacteriaceae bacterium]|nr:phospholipid carrier-dependent glycosyltransferase [Propionibacteriaceae bacterium]